MLCPAEEMYTGAQHQLVIRGIETLRHVGVEVDLAIVSAGYGLITGDRQIAPYEVTFSGMGRRELGEWADYLRIPETVRRVIAPYGLVFFLLGDKYLTAIAPPIAARPHQRLVFLARPDESRLDGRGITLVPAGLELCGRYRAGGVALKGAMFAALCRAVAAEPKEWLHRIHEDDTGEAIQSALSAGLEQQVR